MNAIRLVAQRFQLRTWASPASAPRLVYCNKPKDRTFTSCKVLLTKQLPPRPKVPESDIEEKFVKGSGPGGQKINKTNSAVQLLHKPTGLVLKCQETRSRSQNRTMARRWLSERLEEMELGPQSRVQIKEELQRKRKASKAKKAGRKYKAVEEDVRNEEVDEAADVDRGEDGATIPEEETEMPKDAKVIQEQLPDWERKWRELRGIQ